MSRISYKSILDWVLFDLRQQINAKIAHTADLTERLRDPKHAYHKEAIQNAIRIYDAEIEALTIARNRLIIKIREEQNK